MAVQKKRRRVGQVDLANLMMSDEVARVRKEFAKETADLVKLEQQVAAKRATKIEVAIKLYDLGLPVPVIAGFGEVSSPAIYKWLEEAGREV